MVWHFRGLLFLMALGSPRDYPAGALVSRLVNVRRAGGKGRAERQRGLKGGSVGREWEIFLRDAWRNAASIEERRPEGASETAPRRLALRVVAPAATEEVLKLFSQVKVVTHQYLGLFE